MTIPRIAIVGRPNVGKSSLLNMLAGAKVSIVDPTPGVTRDRVSSVIELHGPDPQDRVKLAEITDTGGYGVYTAEGARFDDAGEDLGTLTGAIEGQIAAAAERADLVLFVIDSQSGVTSLDQTIAKLLRERLLGRRGAKSAAIRVVANKVDGQSWESHAVEGAALGFGEPMIVSALTNFRRRDFIERLWAIVPEPEPGAAEAPAEMKIALVGRRNAGKSSFVNALAGEDRCIVSEIAGTTRDSIDVRFEMDGHALVAIDTAGVRKRTKLADAVEYWALHRCLLAIGRADVVLLLIDATHEVTGIDKRLGRRVLAEHKPCVVVVTKWDLVRGRKNRKGQPVSPEDYAQYLQQEMPGLAYCPIVFTSSVDKVGLREAVATASELFDQARTRVPTSRLNDVFRDILSTRGPSTKLGTKLKVLYVTQVGTQPPTIVLVVNHPGLFKGEYMRYIMNRLHEALPFEEVPIRLLVRERERLSLGQLRFQGRGAQDAAQAEGEELPAELMDIDAENADPIIVEGLLRRDGTRLANSGAAAQPGEVDEQDEGLVEAFESGRLNEEDIDVGLIEVSADLDIGFDDEDEDDDEGESFADESDDEDFVGDEDEGFEDDDLDEDDDDLDLSDLEDEGEEVEDEAPARPATGRGPGTKPGPGRGKPAPSGAPGGRGAASHRGGKPAGGQGPFGSADDARPARGGSGGGARSNRKGGLRIEDRSGPHGGPRRGPGVRTGPGSARSAGGPGGPRGERSPGFGDAPRAGGARGGPGAASRGDRAGPSKGFGGRGGAGKAGPNAGPRGSSGGGFGGGRPGPGKGPAASRGSSAGGPGKRGPSTGGSRTGGSSRGGPAKRGPSGGGKAGPGKGRRGR